jgi:hypothetical protein
LSGGLRPYAGAGICRISYRETNHLGTVTGSGIGFAVVGGLTARWKSLGLDARVKYSSVKDTPGSETIDFGGLTLGLGVGYFF